jgi:hypothetical protein
MDCQTFVKFRLIRMFDEDFESQTCYKYVPLPAPKSGLTKTLLINRCEKPLTLVKIHTPHDCGPELVENLGLVVTKSFSSPFARLSNPLANTPN